MATKKTPEKAVAKPAKAATKTTAKAPAKATKSTKTEKTVPVEKVQEIAQQAATEQKNEAPAPGQVQVNVDFLRTTKVHIAMPCYGGMLTESTFMSFIKWANTARQLGIDWTLETMVNESLISRARNTLTAKFLDMPDATHLFFVDADIGWEPWHLLVLLNRDKDVIGLPVVKKNLNQSYNVKCNPEDLFTNEDGLISVLSIGTGFLYMGKKAIDYLWENSEEYSEADKTGKMVFSVNIKDGQLVSEDVSVCNKLKDGGFDIFIDPLKTCNHIGNLKYTGNFGEFMNKIKSI